MPTYHLAVRRIEQTCLFELNWGQRQRLSAQVPYPESLARAYTDWQRAYLSFYKHALRGRPGATGTVASLPINWHSELAQTEAKLLSEFHRWLRSGDLHEIRDAIAHPKSTQSETDTTELFLTCEPIDIARLPWETWEIGKVQPLRIARSPANIRAEITHRQAPRSGHLRILVIMGDDSGIEIKSDVEAIQQAFKGLGYVQVEGWRQGQDPLQVRDQIRDALVDSRGWDILFFSGHSDEAKVVGGEVLVAPRVSISISEIVRDLDIAKRNGLQFALFNSCAGLDIAETLVESGLSQVAIMREKIHNQVAQTFLVQFLDGLANYLDVHDALLKACQHLKLETHLTYPSAHLVPSFFRHPDAELFQLQPTGWKTWLKQLRPTKREAIALSALAILSLLPVVQDRLMEQRVWAQAVFRQATGASEAVDPPPTLLVQIDDESRQRAGFATEDADYIRRDYLADIVNQLTDLNAQVVGIDYLLPLQQSYDPELRAAVTSAIEKQNTWFVFSSFRNHGGEWVTVNPAIADSNWVISGDIWVPAWHILPLQKDTDRPRPFSYSLAMAQQVQQQAELSIHPELSSTERLSTQMRSQLNQLKPGTYQQMVGQRAWLHPITEFSYGLWQRWLQPLLDFSVPPDQVYASVPAWQLLDDPQLVLQAYDLTDLQDMIVIVAPGGHFDAGLTDKAEDNFPTPPVIAFWRSQTENPNRGLTGGEAHAYMTHHFLRQHFVVPIPDLWMVLVAAVVGKVLVVTVMPVLDLRSQSGRFWLVLVGATAGYGLLSLWIYRAAAMLVPWLLPSVMVWSYMLLAVSEQRYAK
ncbi:MAG: CHASE2 domain-containing protein [Thainema sp.]